jgi:hypothetical protein
MFRNKAKLEKTDESKTALPTVSRFAVSRIGFSDEWCRAQGENTMRSRPFEAETTVFLFDNFVIALPDLQRAQRDYCE